MSRKYTFDMICPRCKREDMIETENREPPPKRCCGDCLMLDVEVVELKIVRVLVGANP